LFNKSSRLAAALGVEKIHTCDCFEFGHTSFVLPKLDKPHREAGLLEQKLVLCCSFRCDQFRKNNGYKLKHFYCLSLTWTYDKPSSEAGLLNKSSCSAAALGVDKLMTLVLNWTKLCCTA
jgi:hypothetical protein